MIYYCDGYCLESNPSKIGGGFSIFNKKGKLIYEERINKSNFTNNEAELLGINKTLKIAKKGDSIISDSQIVIWWIWNGKCGREDLTDIVRESLNLLKGKQIMLAWLPREENLAGHYNEIYEKK